MPMPAHKDEGDAEAKEIPFEALVCGVLFPCVKRFAAERGGGGCCELDRI